MCGYVPMNADALKGQKKASDLLELGLQEAVNSLTQVLGTKLGSSSGATSAPNHRAVSPTRHSLHRHICPFLLLS